MNRTQIQKRMKQKLVQTEIKKLEGKKFRRR